MPGDGGPQSDWSCPYMGSTTAIDARSLGDEFIRTLRLGQRVRFEVEDDEGRQVARELRLVTFAGR